MGQDPGQVIGTMKGKRKIVWNMVWNWGGMAVAMLAGLLVAPLLVRRLGDTTYGLWILMGSLTSYFGLLDLGVRGSVGRNIAYHRARHDMAGVNATLSTALALLCAAAVVALVGTLVLLAVFPRVFDVRAADAAGCRLALLLVGVNVAL